MESWCFDSLDKGYVSSETLPTSDSIMTAKNEMEWEFKPSFSYDNSLMVTTTQNSMEVSGFPEVGFAENMRNLVSSSGVGDMVSTGMVTSNAISGDVDSSSKLSSSVVDSNSRESSLIDLKLGGFGDNNRNSNPSKTARALSSAESSTPVVKRGRLSSLSSQKAYCQVYGCNKDLSSAKDYHKRHRVCDAHSKTSTVIVNGIEQRFCQQCSRFHLLAEFDDGKRSCRKRLAGHNQRRRKTRLSFNGSRVGRSLYSFADSGSIGRKFPGSTLTTSSFICQDILPRNTSQPESHETNGWGKYVKAEDEEVLYAQKSGFLYPKYFTPPYLVDNTNTVGPGNIFSEATTEPYPSELVSRSLFQTNSLGPYDSSLFDAASTVEGCALSLLSSGIPTAHPSISNPVYSLSEISVVENNGLHLGSEGHFPCKDGNTIDLLQLSSQLHRVETQRQTAPVKEETVDGFCCLRMT